jgi:hypothetical protein
MARAPQNDEKLGSNMPASIDEETFLSAIRQADKFDEERDALNKRVGRFRKILKTMGVKLVNFDAVRRLRNLEQSEITGDLTEQFKFMRWLKLKPGTQGELFPKGEAATEPGAAYKHGFGMGVKGEGKRQPPTEFSRGDDGQQWLKGWDDGQKRLGKDFFAQVDYSVDRDEDETESEGPGAGDEDDDIIPEVVETPGKVVNLADAKKAAAPKPPSTPAPKKTATDETISRVAAKKKQQASEAAAKSATSKPAETKAKKAAVDEKKKPTPESPTPAKATKAAEQAAGGGVGGQAPAGARKGGGDFDEDLDLDLDVDDEGDLELE